MSRSHPHFIRLFVLASSALAIVTGCLDFPENGRYACEAGRSCGDVDGGGTGGGVGGGGGGVENDGGPGGGAGGGAGGGVGGGAGGGGGGGLDAGLTYETYCAEFASSYCAAASRCGQISVDGGWCDGSFAVNLCTRSESIQRGFAAFDADSASAILTQLQTATCERLSLREPVLGLSPADGGCETDNDCADPTELACSRFPNLCGQRCLERGFIGNPCTNARTCFAGAWCDVNSFTCRAPAGQNQPCSPMDEDSCVPLLACDPSQQVCVPRRSSGPCQTDRQCTADAWCNYTTGQCEPRGATTQVCSISPSQCYADQYCQSGPNGNYFCAPRVTDGGACAAGTCAQGQSCEMGFCGPTPSLHGRCSLDGDSCPDGLFCDGVTHTCELTRTVFPGDSCTNTRSCGFQCSGLVLGVRDGGVAGTCSLKQGGESCNPGSACAPNLPCRATIDPLTGVCATPDAGSPCNSGYDCAPDDFCGTGGTCVHRGTVGQACSGNNAVECLSSLRCLSADGGTPMRCGPLGDVGQLCASSSDCLFPLDCRAGRCQAAGTVGAPCFGGIVCVEGACNVDAGVCDGATRDAGAACFFASECSSSICENQLSTSGQGFCRNACP